MWGAIIGAVGSVVAAKSAQPARDKMPSTDDENWTLVYRKAIPDPDPESPSKCPSCGSRHFRHHNMVRICSYCRSEA